MSKHYKKMFKSNSKILIVGKKKGNIWRKILFDEETEKASLIKILIVIKDNFKKNNSNIHVINKIYLARDKKFIFKFIKNTLKYKFLINKI